MQICAALLACLLKQDENLSGIMTVQHQVPPIKVNFFKQSCCFMNQAQVGLPT